MQANSHATQSRSIEPRFFQDSAEAVAFLRELENGLNSTNFFQSTEHTIAKLNVSAFMAGVNAANKASPGSTTPHFVWVEGELPDNFAIKGERINKATNNSQWPGNLNINGVPAGFYDQLPFSRDGQTATGTFLCYSTYSPASLANYAYDALKLIGTIPTTLSNGVVNLAESFFGVRARK